MCSNFQIPDLSYNQQEISGKIAYLIGVEKKYIEESPEKRHQFQLLETMKPARIIRNLCICRSSILKNYKKIEIKAKTDLCSILRMPEYIPTAAINQLAMDGADFYKKSSTLPWQHVAEINRLLSDRINNIKGQFPLWMEWDYIRDLFLMPNGLTYKGVQEAMNPYYEHRMLYPYQMYVNWKPAEEGNILYNDEKFVSVLYSQHGDAITSRSLVTDASNFVKDGIFGFLDDSKKAVIVVDCENSDPYKMCAALRDMETRYVQKITKIVLIDDINTTYTWSILENYTTIPVEYKLIERVKKGKSLVDIALTSAVCKEHYRNDIDAFILFSRDSDYWAMISSLPEAKFLVMVERENFGSGLRDVLKEAGIFYCYIDDFFIGSAENIKFGAIFHGLHEALDAIQINTQKLLTDALISARVQMEEAERKQFHDKFLKRMTISVDDSGNVSFNLGGS